MNIQIKIITLQGLEAFMVSSFYKGLTTKPLSLARSLSYIKNPNAHADDAVLFMALEDGQVAAFRTVWPDKVHLGESEYRFAWLSGNWTSPLHRRKGLSKQLLDEVQKAWNNNLMFTNYAPNSEKLYQDWGNYQPVLERTGIRIYLQVNLLKLVETRKPVLRKAPFVVNFTGMLVNAFLMRKNLAIASLSSKINFEHGITPALEMVMTNLPCSSFGRDKKTWQWIVDYPWVLKDFPQLDYPFSYTAQIFDYYSYISPDGQIVLLIKFRDGVFEVPYFYASDDENKMKALDLLLGFSLHLNAEIINIFNPVLVTTFNNSKYFRKLYSRALECHIYGSSAIVNLCKDYEILAQDGDGDKIFT